jgi:steroid 5-alpha reductase family enzyme
MTFVSVFLLIGAVALGLMFLLWLVSLAVRDSSIVDIFWGTGFVVLTWTAFLLGGDGYPPRRWMTAGLVTLWGLRLSLHVLRRNWGKPEDIRYARWREKRGSAWWWISLFQVFLLQGALMWILSAPLVVAEVAAAPRSIGPLEGVALGLWGIGFTFEVVGDEQLRRFRADPANRGRVMDRGLWRYSRHPNYFGDAAQWWGYYLIAASTGCGALTLFSPLLMTLLLVRVSGVALLEKALRYSKPGYAEYMERTPAFVPWLPRRRG